MWYVYILLCKDRSLYTGVTNNLQKRLAEHKNGQGGHYTRARKIVKMIYSEQLSSKSEALKKEIEIKSWDRGRKIRWLHLQLS